LIDLAQKVAERAWRRDVEGALEAVAQSRSLRIVRVDIE
jgi:hypothetical protein